MEGRPRSLMISLNTVSTFRNLPFCHTLTFVFKQLWVVGFCYMQPKGHSFPTCPLLKLFSHTALHLLSYSSSGLKSNAATYLDKIPQLLYTDPSLDVFLEMTVNCIPDFLPMETYKLFCCWNLAWKSNSEALLRSTLWWCWKHLDRWGGAKSTKHRWLTFTVGWSLFSHSSTSDIRADSRNPQRYGPKPSKMELCGCMEEVMED